MVYKQGSIPAGERERNRGKERVCRCACVCEKWRQEISSLKVKEANTVTVKCEIYLCPGLRPQSRCLIL
jgi:hypothetical protein